MRATTATIDDLNNPNLRSHLARLIGELVESQNNYSAAVASHRVYKMRQAIEKECFDRTDAQIDYWSTHYVSLP
jgi:hypothetical protein